MLTTFCNHIFLLTLSAIIVHSPPLDSLYATAQREVQEFCPSKCTCTIDPISLRATVNCSNINVHWLGKIYTPYTVKIDYSHNYIPEITNNDFRDKNCINVAILNISYNSISTIEAQAFENFLNLSILDLSHNKLSVFEPKFHHFVKFAHLDLSYNNILVIDPKIFPKSRASVVTVLLLVNPEFPCASFKSDQLRISKNIKIDCDESQFQITNHKNQIISLSDKNFTFLTKEVFSTYSIDFVTDLILTDNNITNIDDNTFEGFDQLRNVDLRNNKIKQLSAENFRPNKYLEAINITDNPISLDNCLKFRADICKILPKITVQCGNTDTQQSSNCSGEVIDEVTSNPEDTNTDASTVLGGGNDSTQSSGDDVTVTDHPNTTEIPHVVPAGRSGWLIAGIVIFCCVIPGVILLCIGFAIWCYYTKSSTREQGVLPNIVTVWDNGRTRLFNIFRPSPGKAVQTSPSVVPACVYEKVAEGDDT